MDSSLQSRIKRICPRFLLKPAVRVKQAGKERLYRLDMLLFPRRVNFFCPCCGLRFRHFIAGKYLENTDKFNPSRYENTRQDVHCPVCRSLPRHRILALWCEKHMQLFQSSDILYFAPERSMKRWMKRKGVTCKTADLYAAADLELDIQETGLPEESYDVIVCNHVLEHVDDFRAALREVYRILRPGGSFICSFPMDPKVDFLDEDPSVKSARERLERFGQYDHLRVFGMKADRFLTEAGFKVEKISGETCPKEILPVVGPADYDMNSLFCCRK